MVSLLLPSITVDESDGVINFPLRLSSASNETINVSVISNSSSGSKYDDIVRFRSTVSFEPGQTSANLSITIRNDDTAERRQAIELEFESDSPVLTLPQTRTLLEIVDNDQAPTAQPRFVVDPVKVSESEGSATFAVRLTAPSAQQTAVDVSTASDTAMARRDFESLSSQRLVFDPYETVRLVHVPVRDDAAEELAERFDLLLSNPSQGTILTERAQATIAASDQSPVALPSLSVRDVAVSEADGIARIPLHLSAPSDSPITVDVRTRDGSGDEYRDLDGIWTRITFAPGETFQQVPISIYGADGDEGTETVLLTYDAGDSPVRLPERRSYIEITDSDGQAASDPLILVDGVEVGESDEVAAFNLRLSDPSSRPVSVDVSTVDGTATAGSDFAGLSDHTVTFAPYDTVQTVLVDLHDDDVAEGIERFALDLSAVNGATVAAGRAHAAIAASDRAHVATPSLIVDDVVAGEGDSLVHIPLRLSRPSDSAITVGVSTSRAEGSDYRELQGVATTVTFAPGESFAQVPVTLFNDGDAEGLDFTEVHFSAGDSPVFVPEPLIVVELVGDDGDLEASPDMVVDPVEVREGEEVARFDLRLSAPSQLPVSVEVATAAATATSGADFAALSDHTVTFAPGDTVQSVSVDLVDDATAESTEHFDLTLSNPTNANVLTNRASATIAASDRAVKATPVLVPQDVVVSEGDGVARIPLTLDRPSDSVITVGLETASGSGSRFSDIEAVETTVTFAPGQTRVDVPVVVADDDYTEGRQTIDLLLDAGRSPVEVQRAAVLEIVDNDRAFVSAPGILVDDVRVTETGEAARFSLRLSAPSNEATRVDVATLAGTAEAGTDFAALSSETVTFAPGDTAQTVTVDLIDDDDAEGAESLFLSLSNARTGTILTDRATATIAASDQTEADQPTLHIADVTVSEQDPVARVPLRLSAPSADPVTVRLVTDDASGSDYSDLDGGSRTLVFAPGETAMELPLSIFQDDTEEDTEEVVLEVGSVTGASVARSEARVTIVDDDASAQDQPALSIASARADESSGEAVFTLTLAAPSNRAVSVEVSTLPGSAQAGVDFVALQSQRISFGPYDTVQDVRVPLVDDTVAEAAETLSLRLSNAVNARVVDATHEVTIADGDTGRGPNQAPVAANDSYDVTAGSTANLDVRANDGDADGDPLSVQEVGDPAHGTVQVLADGTLDYMAERSYIGTDRFNYTIGDGQGGQATATVEINVTAPAPRGTSGPDRLEGSAAGDRIEGHGGDDVLRGLEGDDILMGGDGRDRLIGGDGNDTIRGGSSDADLRDEVYAGRGDDLVDGGYGNDLLRGDAGDDTLAGGFGVDRVIGNAGDDVMTGSAFSDLLFGGPGFDFVNGGFGFDRVNGGDGADRFFHNGDPGHGSDWIQDYDAGEGDVLLYGGQANANQFRVITTEARNSGQAGVEEAFVVHTPTGQILWALVDGAAQSEINLRLGGQDVDLFG